MYIVPNIVFLRQQANRNHYNLEHRITRFKNQKEYFYFQKWMLRRKRDEISFFVNGKVDWKYNYFQRGWFTSEFCLIINHTMQCGACSMGMSHRSWTATILGHELKINDFTDWATFNLSSNNNREWKSSSNKSSAFAITLPHHL